MGDNIPQRVADKRRDVLRILLLPIALLVLCCCGPGCGDDDQKPGPEHDQNSQGDGETFLVMRPAFAPEGAEPLMLTIRCPSVHDTHAAVYEIRGEYAPIRTEAELHEKFLAHMRIADPKRALVVLQASTPLLWRWVLGAVDSAKRAGFRYVVLSENETFMPVEVVTTPAVPMSPNREEGPSDNVIVVRGLTGKRRGAHRRLDGMIIDGKRVSAHGWQASIERRVAELKKAGRKDISVRIAFHPEIRCCDVWPVTRVCSRIGHDKLVIIQSSRGRSSRDTVGSFYGQGLGAGAKHVVFVIDRSGSMVTVFDYVHLQLQLSISNLNDGQDFHIILMADEKTIEGPSNELVKATGDKKIAVVDFLERDDVRPRGRTTALVALKRAFEVLEKASDRKGKVIFLLTDGEFAGIGGGSRYKGASGNEAVLSWLADNNKNREVTIKTVLYTHGKSEKAKAVMNKIARDHGGGRAKLISSDE